ncbi:MAG: hypothetical protein G01um101418_882 [Parcubacteria group bacterium Gr01-1014_18]|nr:MAG: hypothetical protein Greene041636_921 [Parcubacteria group bacterium Greene0416_36]TSC79778.1 MAG: hypothetical protein G01um101418_882 [Parcubacteria group bacterium Gr01-1014_18]TSC98062.1 MAG: hypothetical protein Greene101420_891 [Parcubacteria group bacterium Greene1014_20]TSD06498.1 MAG: hypothetical protein Greene07142_841 [Parcubacteria group bacterium Greene0714_2]
MMFLSRLNMSKSPINYIRHIGEEVDFIISAMSGKTFQNLTDDLVLQKAIVRSLEIIGEATKRVDDSFRKKYPLVYWREMAGTRDRLIHDYFDIDYQVVWDIIQNDIPVLKEQVNLILKDEIGK